VTDTSVDKVNVTTKVAKPVVFMLDLWEQEQVLCAPALRLE